MKSTVDVLREARALLSDPQRWHQGYYSNDDGSAFCAVGACMEAEGSTLTSAVGPAHDALMRALPKGAVSAFIPIFNDHPDTTHADVLALFDRAIANEEAKAQEFDGDLSIDAPELVHAA